jgi:hypothetical protein
MAARRLRETIDLIEGKNLLMKMKNTIDEIDRLTTGRNSRRVLDIPRRRFSGVIFFLIQQPIYFRNKL